ncbi:hypothetical protein UNDKW_4020 [Undibacterium sp. KW1]|uniref:NUDIX domain-containing protein n=1 Tax=Undibacterium sp. KW1 TaxID=2058624 RepID=UPI001331DCB1|nr:NUDIX domain-containing protein [Undibacterium sp. KW1]BBB62275.1 hypothetical protein UNDKW_4002 [Undibacterium sp. KW1]BBB62293.1 hypothetical protein UNDKW_4020 [Undibacterium sp. KW1]
MNRKNLPYREKTELFLLTRSYEILAQDHGKYIMFPGGGVDPNEDIVASSKRELLEEVGYEIVGDIYPVVTVEWDWFPEWANTATRKARYEEFRGERVFLFCGLCQPSKAEGEKHGDQWQGNIAMGIDACLSLFDAYCMEDHVNTYAYRIAQRCAINSTKLLKLVR